MSHAEGSPGAVPPGSGVDVLDLDLPALVALVEARSNSHPTACVEIGEKAVERAQAVGDPHSEMKIQYFLGFARHLLSHDHAALAAMERALCLAEELGDRHWQARIRGGLGAAHSGFGDNASAIELLEQSLALRRELGDTFGIAAALNNLGVTFEEMGLFPDRARELLTEAYTLFDQLGNDHGRCASLTHLASLDTTASEALAETDPVAAAGLATHALLTARKAVGHARALEDNNRLLGECLIRQARAHLACEEVEAAQTVLDEAEALTSLVDTTHFLLRLASTKGRLHRTRGDLRAATEEIERGLEISNGVLRSFERVELLTELVAIHVERGAYADALAAHRQLLTATLQQREDAAERRARVINAQLDVERSQVEAEVERLRSAQLEIANRELAYDATHDSLTGLLNRRGFDAALAARTLHDGEAVTVLLGDLDHFKVVNDEWSHAVGDRVLREVALLAGGAVRGTDQVARVGGEEIAVILAEGSTEVRAVCERIRSAVEGFDWASIAPGITVTISIGAATRRPGESIPTLLDRADGLLYAAKQAGRNLVRTDGVG